MWYLRGAPLVCANVRISRRVLRGAEVTKDEVGVVMPGSGKAEEDILRFEVGVDHLLPFLGELGVGA